ncbi:hypothetical protein JGE30_24630, partial [Salmonella enterica subsp. enterica serovar Give]|nr:hypothetical protein [Salmonella enterica subsp. enterica serovar Give]
MEDKAIYSLDDVEEYCRRYERRKDLDSRYTPPPPKEKARIPGAAYSGATSSSAKVAVVTEAVREEKKREEPKPEPKKRKTAKAEASGVEQQEQVALAAAVQVPQAQMAIPATNTQSSPPVTYASVVQRTPPPVNMAFARPQQRPAPLQMNAGASEG